MKGSANPVTGSAHRGKVQITWALLRFRAGSADPVAGSARKNRFLWGAPYKIMLDARSWAEKRKECKLSILSAKANSLVETLIPGNRYQDRTPQRPVIAHIKACLSDLPSIFKAGLSYLPLVHIVRKQPITKLKLACRVKIRNNIIMMGEHDCDSAREVLRGSTHRDVIRAHMFLYVGT